MTADPCRDWRGALASAAIGRLDDSERVALQAHLDGCSACRVELAELTAVARTLPRADLARVADESGEPPAHLETHILDRVADEQGRSHRRRWRRVVAVAAVVVVGVGLGAVVATSRDRSTPAATVAFATGVEAASGRAELDARDTGTEVRLVATGLDPGDWYWLWLTGDGGDRVTAGTFRGTDDEVDVTLTAALALEDARRIWVTDGDDEVVLDATL
jgi:anti-sigma factor RsiW